MLVVLFTNKASGTKMLHSWPARMRFRIRVRIRFNMRLKISFMIRIRPQEPK